MKVQLKEVASMNFSWLLLLQCELQMVTTGHPAVGSNLEPVPQLLKRPSSGIQDQALIRTWCLLKNSSADATSLYRQHPPIICQPQDIPLCVLTGIMNVITYSPTSVILGTPIQYTNEIMM